MTNTIQYGSYCSTYNQCMFKNGNPATYTLLVILIAQTVLQIKTPSRLFSDESISLDCMRVTLEP
ncbi:hypothetical protein K492DRAFT_201748 [Lichtheimia hyalospora FSU 10163]|nr:hypothetical protein K492DRAFT_201748 [Lichtheimia hyalospora FSU 10163]